MKILVTGSEGYLGIPLTKMLREQGFDVVGLDTNFYSEVELFNGFPKLTRVIAKDTRRVSKDDFTGIDAIVHLAELSNDPLGHFDPALTEEINHKGTIHLAKTAKTAGVSRFIYYSSCTAYGASDEIVNETSPLRPLTPYGECKKVNEQALLALADDFFSPVIFRNATAFGPSPHMRFDLVVNNLVGLAMTEGEIKMESDGLPWRPFVHVQDIARATICAIAADRDIVHKEIFNVGGMNANYQIRDIATIIGEVFPHCAITLNVEGADKRNYRADFSKINTQLPGFVATMDLKTGVLELKSLFEKIGLTKEQFWSKNFTRLKQIQYLRETGKVDNHLFWV